jgi:acetylornithine deacetylase/succinyl-diaminopimelate desuccinylase-like protein
MLKHMPRMLVLLFVSSLAAQTIDWKAVEAETLTHFTAILRMDTSNPPGNETKVAEYLKSVLEKEGIETKLLAVEPGRANLVARLRGSGAKKPILVMGHTDVVGVQKEKWTVDPFSAERKDGFLYARGATDDKDNVVAGLMLLLLLKRSGATLDRDVIFMAEAGEENFWLGGARYVVNRHFGEIEAEYCLAEGGGGITRNGQNYIVSIATTEKVSRGVTLRAKGTAGHGSVPVPDNAVARLAGAVAKIAAWMPPMHFNDTTRTFFERLATISTPEDRERINALFDESKRAAAERYFAEKQPRFNSMLRTSISPTILKAGFRSNVIPSEAEAFLDIRALPDEDMLKFYDRMREVINDPNVEIVYNAERLTQAPPPPSPLHNEMWKALESAAAIVYPGAAVLPSMLTGGTDMGPLRAKGVACYGVGHLNEEKNIGSKWGAHSDDERIPEAELHRFVRFQWEAVRAMAQK